MLRVRVHTAWEVECFSLKPGNPRRGLEVLSFQLNLIKGLDSLSGLSRIHAINDCYETV